MRTTKLIFGALLMMLIFTTGCKKEETTTPEDTTGAFFKCKIDGVDFDAQPITVGGFNTQPNFQAQGNTGGLSAKSLTIGLNSTYSGVGTYSFGSGFLSNTVIYLPKVLDQSVIYGSAFLGTMVGQMEITKDDGSIVEGTFSFELADQMDNTKTVNVTAGSFRLKL